jgi:RNA polymerase sigma-70 factor (ECF subfamily)
MRIGEADMTAPHGDRERRFLDLVESHQGILHKVCALYAETRDKRDDLRQEILMQLWRSFPSFAGRSLFSTWMYRVALNTAMLRRRRLRTQPVTDTLDQSEPLAAASTGDDPDVERLHRCIRRLKELDRAVILLYLEQHTYEEIAELTGLTRKNVSVRIVRIKQRLRECLLTPIPSGSRSR